jgi:hypothetical protein
MKSLVFMMALMISGLSFGQAALGEVIGEVVDPNTKIGIVDVHVFIDDNGTRYQAKTDFDGRFRISAIPAGTYIMNVRQHEDTLSDLIVEVPMDGFFNAGVIEFSNSVTEIGPVTFNHRNNIKLVDGNLPVRTMTAKEIDKSPLKFDVKGLVSSMTSEVRMTEDGELVFRGARKGDMIYLVDGVKTRDVGSVPGVSIGRMMVYTGGLPAKYGDTLGGVVVMESKSYFDLYRAWEAQQIREGKR